MIIMFFCALCLFLCFLLAPLDRFSAIKGTGELTIAEALYTKIVGSCMLMTILVCSAFKIDELYIRIKFNKIGLKRKK